jgi:hypothetical protein
MAFNVVYNSNSSTSPAGFVAGVNLTNAYVISVPFSAQTAPQGNPDAGAVITSNGENIANVVRKSNPFPPGLTS